ncbi:hypothetical protein PVK06_011920 [Gossypium arboreum]|uniref:Uncharacterized protein n=1 Tax=Gossypium arboreum TaxID=29729 RepID=A0ABR0QAV7_GOSAR|nr:hypothetical protein PVK06_011920 [Gossypium arboreum]
MDIIIDYLTDEKGEWTHQLDIEFPISFPHKEEFCMGALIYRSMIRCVCEKKIGLLFPHLVIALWKQEKVPIGTSCFGQHYILKLNKKEDDHPTNIMELSHQNG